MDLECRPASPAGALRARCRLGGLSPEAHLRVSQASSVLSSVLLRKLLRQSRPPVGVPRSAFSSSVGAPNSGKKVGQGSPQNTWASILPPSGTISDGLVTAAFQMPCGGLCDSGRTWPGDGSEGVCDGGLAGSAGFVAGQGSRSNSHPPADRLADTCDSSAISRRHKVQEFRGTE